MFFNQKPVEVESHTPHKDLPELNAMTTRNAFYIMWYKKNSLLLLPVLSAIMLVHSIKKLVFRMISWGVMYIPYNLLYACKIV